MMKKISVIGMMLAMLLITRCAQADVCEILNGSFELDGSIFDIRTQDPNSWQLTRPGDNFRGYILTDWPTDETYNLTLYSEQFSTFEPNDMATVSQSIDLADANQIRFDVKLESSSTWDPNISTAVLLIDDDVVWESNSVGTDVRGEYLDQTYVVEDKYRDGSLHKLSLGIRVNVGQMLFRRYYTHWDHIECTLFCGGGGLLAGDFNRDCYVDVNDLKLAADVWLNEVNPDNRVNLFQGDDLAGYGTINFSDFAIYADGWDGDAADLGMFAQKWLNEVPLDDQYNLFKDDDVEPKGIVNFSDFSMFADNWLSASYEQLE